MNKNQTPKNSSRYAVIGLWLSALSIIALAISVAVKVFEVMGLYTVDDLTLLPRLIWGSAGGILIGLAIFAILAPKRVRALLTGRQAKYGSNALVISIAFIGILIFGNVLAFQNPVPIDWTETKENTLAPETINVLQSLPQTVSTSFQGTAQAFQSSLKGLWLLLVMENYERTVRAGLNINSLIPIKIQ